jgi:carboxyl-terminal processing protease
MMRETLTKKTLPCLIALCLCAIPALFSSAVGPAELTPLDVLERSKEMMSYHPTFKNMNTELAARLLVTFCDELDPCKTYLLKSEVAEWMDPTPAVLEQVLVAFRTGQFGLFDQMLRRMGSAIERRGALERRLEADQLPKHVILRVHEFDWADGDEELYQRLRTMRGAQLEAAGHLEKTLCQTALQRLQKNRLAFEQLRNPKDPLLFRQTLATFLMKSFANALDSESTFFTPTEAKQLVVGMQQRLFGIGVLLRDDIDGFSVIKLVEGGPAVRQKGLELGDKIIAVNEDPVIGLDIMDVVEMIRGEPGSIVRLKLVRKSNDGKGEVLRTLDVRLKRGEVVVRDLRFGSQVLPCEGGVIAHLRLHSFYQDADTSSYADLLATLSDLQKEYSVKGVILDLRCNPGGLLTQAVSVTGLFIDKGVVVSIKEDEGSYSHMRNIASKKAWDGPLIVLVNRASASASEIVAQALQDWGRAIVLGDDRSFGKGSFQIFTLSPDGTVPPNPRGEYKVTRGRYYTVSGKTPQLVGVQSDVVVPGLLSFAEIGEMYSKFPLSSDIIASHFEDSFEDVPLFQRALLQKLYSFGHQVPLERWTSCIPELRRRSAARLSSNADYQKFIKTVKEGQTDYIAESSLDSARDFQLEEAQAVMNDLVVLAGDPAERADARAA